uniref:Cytochrome P450 71D10 n=1 Tax=Aegilops tauschii TaxID=37682 RepID=N1QQG7_AEGTA
MRDLARRHGPVMLLRLGEVPTLVVSSPEAAREVMKTHDMLFATRPLNSTMSVLTNGAGRSYNAQFSLTPNDLTLLEAIFIALNGILDTIIRERLERTTEGGGGENKDHHLVDVLLSMHKEGRLDMDAVKNIIFDIFSAGSETTVIEWAMAELMRNPEAMRKATAEVRRALEARGSVEEHALGELPYLHLVIREVLRLHAPTPLLIPRECREPCQVLGYDVPRGTQVFVNAWAIARDERYWPDAPEEFRPERFEGEGAVDFRGNDFSFLPFGSGRRMCPGMAFGLAIIELTLASLLFHFDWEVLPGAAGGAAAGELDMAEVFGLAARRKADLPLRPVLRVPVPGL